MKNKKHLILLIICIIIITAFSIYVGKVLINYLDKPDVFKNWVLSHGILAYFVYILITIIQIVLAFIPGEPFELISGYAFGPIKGSFLCLLAESIGSLIVLLIVNKFGHKLVYFFFGKEKVDSVLFLISKKKYFVIFSLLFILSGSPKDLLCYIAGLSKFKLIPTLIIVSIGRIPSIFSSTISAGMFSNKSYEIGALLLLITIIISGLGILIYSKIIKDLKKSD